MNMNIKISEDKLEKIIDTVVNGIGITDDLFYSFQPVSYNNISRIEFLTPGTRENMIARYYKDLHLIVVNDDRLYDLVSVWVGSHKLYDMIKGEVIKRIYRKYTDRYKSIYKDGVRNIKYMSDEEFNKK